MPASSDHELDQWIAARRQGPSAHLAPAVMQEILKAAAARPQSAPQPERPSLLLTSTCLVAGIGKLSLVIHFAF